MVVDGVRWTLGEFLWLPTAGQAFWLISVGSAQVVGGGIKLTGSGLDCMLVKEMRQYTPIL
jgi:hypothetical protein